MIFRFTLTYNGVDTNVVQPRGWKDFKSELKRDFDSHGVMFEYTSGTLKLGFISDGRDVLESAFRLEGFDAQVTFKAEGRETVNDSYSTLFEGTAIMENRQYDKDYFEVDFETDTFKQTFLNRIKTKVRLDTTIDLDGGTLSGSINKESDTWNTIRLYRTYDALLTKNDVFIEGNGLTEENTGSQAQYTDFGFGVKRRDTLDNINLRSASVSVHKDSYLQTDKPIPIYTAEKGGPIDLDCEVSFTVRVVVYHAGTVDVQSSYALKLKQFRDGAEESTSTISSDNDTQAGASAPSTSYTYVNGAFPISDTINTSFSDVESGDEFYLVIETTSQVSSGAHSMETRVRIYNDDNDSSGDSYITITQLPVSEEVDVSHYLVHDVFDRLSYILTGQQDSFYSDFFGLTDHGYASDGCGGLNSIVSGKMLRGIGGATSTVSMKEMLDWASARYGCGWGFEKDGSDYRIRVEPMEHFYSGGEILDIGSPVSVKKKDSYSETTYEDLLINNVEIGYSKYFNEIGINGLFEDFLTVSEYSLPIKTVGGDYKKIVPFIASNDLIQATYDERENKSTSWKYDDDNFIVALARDSSDFVQENNENFTTVTGLDDADTAYNLRHAPVYMLLEHALLLNSTLYGKSLDELIQNTSVKVNTAFTVRYDASADCKLGDVQRLTRSSTGNIEIGDNYVGYRLWNPVVNKLTVLLTNDQWNDIKEAMENDHSTTSKNLGYITYRDDRSNTKQGFLLMATRSPIERIAEIELLELADNYGI
jgi:hypothetical protein